MSDNSVDSDKEAIATAKQDKHLESEKSGPCSENESHSDEDNRTEDDPLSDVWESDDSQFDQDEDKTELESKPLKHNYANVKTKSGNVKLDLTPPDQLLVEAQSNMNKFYKQKMADECIRESIRCLMLTTIIYHYDKPWLLAKCHANIGKMYWQMKEFALQTREHATKALKYLSVPLTNTEKPDKKEILEIGLLSMYLVGKSYLASRQFNEAESHLLKAEKLLNERKQMGKMKEKDFWTTELYTALSRIKIHQKNIDEGIAHLEIVRKLLSKRYGEENPKLIPLYHELAKMEQMKGAEADHEISVDYCTKAHSIAQESFEEINPLKGDAAFALATAYLNQNSEEAEIYAESYLNEAINDYELSLGKANAKTLKAKQALAKHFASKNRHGEAVTLLEAGIPAVIETFGEDSYQRAQTEKLLATYCLQAGDSSEAKKHLKECFRVEVMRYGPHSVKSKQTKEALDILLKMPKMKGNNEDEKARFNAIVKTTLFSNGYKPIPFA